MRKVTEKRTCDRCEKALYQDAGRWLGGTMQVDEWHGGTDNICGSREAYDLCQNCIAELKTWMKEMKR